MRQEASIATLPGILKKEIDRSSWVTLYTSLFTALGIALFALALTHLPANRLGLLIFAVLAGVAELSSVQLFSSSRGSSVSVSSVISTASVFIFGPLGGAIVSTVSGLVTIVTAVHTQEPVKDRASWLRRSGFNIGMFASATAFGGSVFVLTGGTPGDVAHWSNFAPLVLAVSADTVANLAILIGVIALQTGKSPRGIWEQDFQWSVPINIFGGIFGGGALALAYSMFGLPGLVVFFLPVLSTSYSLRIYARNTKVYVERLEQLNRGLDEANLGLLETLGAVIDADDIYTYGHSTQVATYAGALADRMHLSHHERDILVRAALVHDIGKVGIMDTILGKEGALTNEEYNVIKRHTIIGAGIVGRMKGLKELVPLVLHHHERWDGKGYPDGLEREEIPLGARILALADALDVLCSDRPYRATLSFREAKEEIARCAGTQFDPDVVKALFEMMEEQGRQFFKNSAASVDRNVLMKELGGVGDRVRYLKRSMIGAVEVDPSLVSNANAESTRLTGVR